MSANSKIEWTDHTFNGWEGCEKISPGCDNCYAEARNARFAGGVATNWGPGAERRRTSGANWNLPKRWNAQHAAFHAQHGRRQRVFCASLSDVFDNQIEKQWRDDLWQLIWETPHLDWQLLTKRIGNVMDMLPDEWGNGLTPYWPHVWIGATVVNQTEADRDIPKLIAVPAAKRFLSLEPLLGPVDLRLMSRSFGFPKHITRDGHAIGMPQGLHQVIVGGESGRAARPMHPEWARSLRDQCAYAGIPFLFKQWGEWISTDQEACPSGPPFSRWEWADGTAFQPGDGNRAMSLFCKAGKKSTGRLLDEITHDGFPA
ncbi:phage Gp37/Gp68 family protein [Polaromonas naphthalenivorans]|uniref:Phage Gp37Gp68 family protein n=1 Tax=Polaromonas naphthalenivorans (strain CJ2) TaxID=365044 RepID=A1VSK0_POLNA|nr:phage Gp37/Gp68 family protein [Polaromonas naphthalenivorans]ABM38628.1 phage Gp37Gp68 family protein [Polaromonas naphthalenivorans CJ2]